VWNGGEFGHSIRCTNASRCIFLEARVMERGKKRKQDGKAVAPAPTKSSDEEKKVPAATAAAEEEHEEADAVLQPVDEVEKASHKLKKKKKNPKKPAPAAPAAPAKSEITGGAGSAGLDEGAAVDPAAAAAEADDKDLGEHIEEEEDGEDGAASHELAPGGPEEGFSAETLASFKASECACPVA
jgi:hypothetical protein